MSSQVHLLVVDDEALVCQSCARILEREGFKVQTCTDPREGLRLASVNDYGAILLDIRMPELGGVEFLRRLREVDSNVPVIVITGYGGVSAAAEVMRLRAADYIPKPFTPQEITDAVARVIPLPRTRVATPPQQQAPRALPTGEIRFLGRGWASVEADGTALVGGFLAREEGQSTVALRVARPRDYVARGLPVAQATLADGRVRAIPCPLSGEVLEVNEALTRDPAAAWADPCRTGWVARIRPLHPETELTAASVRWVVLATTNADRSREHASLLARLGCNVQLAATPEGAISVLRSRANALLLLDVDSFGGDGPGFVRAVHEKVPAAKVVVLASEHSPSRAAFVPVRILYYALSPFEDFEIIDILDTAFVGNASVRTSVSGPLPREIRRIQSTDPQGQEVALLSSDGLLREDGGLGALLLERLRAKARPVQVSLGARPFSRQDLARVASTCQRMILLSTADMGKLPGSVAIEPSSKGESEWPGDGVETVRIKVQPLESALARASFDEETVDAMARLILEQMG